MWKLYKLLPLPYYGPEDEGKSAAQVEREKIKVTSSASRAADEAKEAKDDNDNSEVSEGSQESEENEEESEEGEEEGESEESKEENGEQEQELTTEQKRIKALERKIERLQRRVGKTVGERDAIKKDLADAKASLEAKLADGEQPLTEVEVNRRAKEIAENELSAREYQRAEEKLINDATKLDKNFMSKVNDMAAEVAPIPQFFIGALNDVDNGGEVLNYLTDNHDEYEDLIGKKTPMAVMKGLLEISNKLIEAKKPKPKPISKVPDPPKPLKGNSGTPDTLPQKPTENMEEFIRVRNKQEAEKRKARFG